MSKHERESATTAMDLHGYVEWGGLLFPMLNREAEPNERDCDALIDEEIAQHNRERQGQ